MKVERDGTLAVGQISANEFKLVWSSLVASYVYRTLDKLKNVAHY